VPPGADQGVKTVEILIIKTMHDCSLPLAASILSILGFSILVLSTWGTLWYIRLQRCELVKIEENPETTNQYRKSLIDKLKAATPTPVSKRDEIVHSVLNRKRPKVDELTKPELKNETKLNFRNFLCAIPLLSIIYMVPSVQMVYNDAQRYITTGSMDHCYLNYGCSRPWENFADFNHIASNAGYLIYGLFFTLLVFIKSKTLKNWDKDNGIPRNYSYFYAMGVCMVLQSIFSSIFHICPSNISLQFDTTIMYIMMLLVFVQTYSFRHSDISPNAFLTLYLFAAALVMEALSLYATSYTTRIFLFISFCVFFGLVLVNVVINIYYYGAVKALFPQKTIIFMEHSYSSCEFLYPRKFALSVCFLVINILLMVGTIIRCLEDHGRSLSTPFLVIGAVNIFLYLMFYLVLKAYETYEMLKKPSTSRYRLVSPIFCFIILILAIIMAFMAGKFYINKHQSRNHTPEESRDKNEQCSYMDFFDNHDMWHFLSASSLFLAFIFLLSIDDDLLCTPRANIDVF